MSTEGRPDEPVFTWQRLAAAVLGVLAIALVGSYLVPGGGLPFGPRADTASGWTAIPWDVCGSVRSVEELERADLDDPDLCAAWLEARDRSGGDDEFFVLTGDVDPIEFQRALAPSERATAQLPTDEHEELHMLLVRSPGNRFTDPPVAGTTPVRVDTMALWYPSGDSPAELGTVLLSSESESYPALERLISP